MKKICIIILILTAACLRMPAQASVRAVSADSALFRIPTIVAAPPSEPLQLTLPRTINACNWVSPYALPYTPHSTGPEWHRMWINTAVLSGAFIGTLFVLELLPEDATAWNRAAISEVPMFKRWFRNVFKKGPEWDHDNPIFNFVLHPYAGAAYFMAARSCGFNYYQSLLYSALISTVGWEFGIEGCMERPSYQDIFITPLCGSILGECFYQLKHHIVNNGYRLWGSPVLGNIVAFLIDPVNEVLGIFDGNPARKYAKTLRHPKVTSALMPYMGKGAVGFSFTCTF